MDSHIREPSGWGHYFKMCALYVMLIVSAFLFYFAANYTIQLYQIENQGAGSGAGVLAR